MKLKAFGKLMIRTSVADGAIPIEGCLVIISGAGESNGDIKHSVITDEDGVTPWVRLPTSDKIYSLSPDPAEVAYAVYDVLVAKEGFYTKTVKDVAVFAEVEAVLPVNMIPYVPYTDGGSYPRGNNRAVITENEML